MKASLLHSKGWTIIGVAIAAVVAFAYFKIQTIHAGWAAMEATAGNTQAMNDQVMAVLGDAELLVIGLLALAFGGDKIQSIFRPDNSGNNPEVIKAEAKAKVSKLEAALAGAKTAAGEEA